MRKVTLNDKTYIIGNLDVFQQLHVARKVAPILGSMGTSLNGVMQKGKEAILDTDNQMIVYNAAMDVVAAMSEADVNYVVQHCLAVVKRVEGDAGAQPVANGKVVLFDDIKLPTLVQLCVNVVQENLSDFFPLLGAVSDSSPN